MVVKYFRIMLSISWFPLIGFISQCFITFNENASSASHLAQPIDLESIPCRYHNMAFPPCYTDKTLQGRWWRNKPWSDIPRRRRGFLQRSELLNWFLIYLLSSVHLPSPLAAPAACLLSPSPSVSPVYSVVIQDNMLQHLPLHMMPDPRHWPSLYNSACTHTCTPNLPHTQTYFPHLPRLRLPPISPLSPLLPSSPCLSL